MDQRTDIWSFGVILYEMLAGKRLFLEETVGDTLAAVIRAEPDWDALPAEMPRDLRRLLERCLRRKPAQRLYAIADARLELEELETEAVPVVAPALRSTWRPSPGWIFPLMVGLVVGAWIWGASTEPTTEAVRPVVRSTIELPEETQLAGWSTPIPEISPDGRVIAYVATSNDGQHLYLRRLDDARTIRVPDSDGAEGPFFSPDGRSVAFGAGSISGLSDEPRRLKRYSLETGLTSTICEVGDYFGGCWRDDDTIFFVNVQPLGIWKVSAGGGTPRPVGGDQVNQTSLAWPQLLPGGEEALVTVWEGSKVGRIYRVDLRTGAREYLGVDGVFARWLPSGHLLVADIERRILAYRFDPAKAVPGEGGVRVLENVTLTGNEGAAFAVSSTGTFLYCQGPIDGSRRDLSTAVWIAEDGARTEVDLPADYYRDADVSPDGTRLALTVDSREVRIFDLDRGTQLKLPQGEAASAGRVLWGPAGERIVFTGSPLTGDSGINLFLQSTDGVRPPRALERRAGEFFPWSWVPGTSRLLHYGFPSDGRIHTRIYEIDVEGPGEPREILQEEGSTGRPAISPDGRWLAYVSRESGTSQIYLRSFPDLSRKIPVALGSRPIWTKDGNTLYFSRSDGRFIGSIHGITVSYANDDVELGSPRTILELDRAVIWDPDPNGGRHLLFFGLPGAGEIRSLQMVQGWTQELERLLPGATPSD